jgi:hypothetical protein
MKSRGDSNQSADGGGENNKWLRDTDLSLSLSLFAEWELFS